MYAESRFLGLMVLEIKKSNLIQNPVRSFLRNFVMAEGGQHVVWPSKDPSFRVSSGVVCECVCV